MESLLHLSPEEAQSRLQQEAVELGRERAQQSRAVAGVSSLMYRDVQVGGCGWMGVCVYTSQTEMQCKVMGDPHHVQIRHLKYLPVQTHAFTITTLNKAKNCFLLDA